MEVDEAMREEAKDHPLDSTLADTSSGRDELGQRTFRDLFA